MIELRWVILDVTKDHIPPGTVLNRENHLPMKLQYRDMSLVAPPGGIRWEDAKVVDTSEGT